MERYELDRQPDDDQSAVIAKTMISAVVAMALMMVATILLVQSGMSIIA